MTTEGKVENVESATLKTRWRPRRVQGLRITEATAEPWGGEHRKALCWDFTLFMVLSPLARMKASHSPISEDGAAITSEGT